jgi:serine/threonine-protein kinase
MRTSRPAILRPGQTLGPYRVEGELGAGGMGRVYLASDTTLKRTVAIKFVDRTRGNASDLLREARLAASLDHPFICRIHGVGHFADEPFIVMEHVKGVPLSKMIQSQGALPLRSALSLELQIADALAHAHEHGIVHGDIKGSNVMVGAGGRVTILDFGLAVRRIDYDEWTTADADTTWPSPSTGGAGTVPYMSPERIRGLQPDVQSDIWAMGVVLYEMLSGARPFNGATAFEMAAHILFDHRIPLLGCPPAIATVIERCLNVNPLGRYTCARELWGALRGLGEENGESWPSNQCP